MLYCLLKAACHITSYRFHIIATYLVIVCSVHISYFLPISQHSFLQVSGPNCSKFGKNKQTSLLNGSFSIPNK